MKCFVGSEKDLSDARDVLKAAVKKPVDIDLVGRLSRRFGRPAFEQVLTS